MLVTVCIPFCFEGEFLKGSLRQIFKHRHNDIDYEIILCDQADKALSDEIMDIYGNNDEIKIVKLPRVDAGYPIDVSARMAKGEYFCSLDADAFPISNKWLWLPIKLIDKYGLSYVGKESGLHHSYKSLGDYYHINNYYRLSKTSIAVKCSEDVGFMRPSNRRRVDMKFNVDMSIGCDNGVVAQWYSDKMNMGPKLGLFMDKIIGKTPTSGVYGMIIDDLVFHMVFGQTREEHISGGLGEEYYSLNNDIYKNGLTDETINKLLSMSKTENILDLYGYENLIINGRSIYENGSSRFLTDDDDIQNYIKYLKEL